VTLCFELSAGTSEQNVKYRFNLNQPASRLCLDMLDLKPHADAMPEFNLLRADTDAFLVGDEAFDRALHYPKAVFRFGIFREPERMLIEVVFPLLVLCAADLAVDVASQYDSKLSDHLTVLIVLFAYLTAMRGAVPRLPRFTKVDVLIFVCIFSVLLGILETVLVHYGLAEEFGAATKRIVALKLLVFVWCVLTLAKDYLRYRLWKRHAWLEKRELHKRPSFHPDLWDRPQ